MPPSYCKTTWSYVRTTGHGKPTAPDPGRLLRTEPDGTTVEHGRLREVAGHGWNEIAVTRGGDVYVNGFAFDLAGGGAPQPGVIALVRPNGSTVQVADGLRFPNGMVVTPDGATLIVAESFAGQLTAYDIRAYGTLSAGRAWAEGVAPDGICLDADGAVWCGRPDIRMMTGRPDGPAGGFVRVLEGGEVTDRIELDRPGFACALGGPDGGTLFMLTMQWRGFDVIDATAAERTGAVFAAPVAVPAAQPGDGRPRPGSAPGPGSRASTRSRTAAGSSSRSPNSSRTWVIR